jgi:hypothetical protein
MYVDRNQDVKMYLVDTVKWTLSFILFILILSALENVPKSNDQLLASSLLFQSGKWYRMCTQNQEVIYALQQCDYAIAYLNAARHAAPDSFLEKTNKTDLHKYHNKLLSHQTNLLKKINPKQISKRKTSPQPSWLTS